MDSVLKRRLFMEPPARKASGGILSLVEDDEEEGSYDDRSPENPEIMANALRGDMRSMDERYLELAQMVGEAAFETPEEVLVLMQPQLAQRQAQQQPPTAPAAGPQGLAALGQGVPPGGAPGGAPEGAMPPGMPMEAPPEMGPQGIAALAPENEPQGMVSNQAPVQRQAGSPPAGERRLPDGSFAIDIQGVAPEIRSENIPPVTQIPTVQAGSPPPYSVPGAGMGRNVVGARDVGVNEGFQIPTASALESFSSGGGNINALAGVVLSPPDLFDGAVQSLNSEGANLFGGDGQASFSPGSLENIRGFPSLDLPGVSGAMGLDRGAADYANQAYDSGLASAMGANRGAADYANQAYDSDLASAMANSSQAQRTMSSEAAPMAQSAQPQSAQPQSAQPQSAQPQSAQPQSAQPQSAQPQSYAITPDLSKIGAGLGLAALAALASKGGGKGGGKSGSGEKKGSSKKGIGSLAITNQKDIDDLFKQYGRMMALVAPMGSSDAAYLADLEGRNAEELILGVAPPLTSSGAMRSEEKGAEVFPVADWAGSVSKIPPVKRATGSPSTGERTDPFIRIQDEINEPRKRQARIPRWQQQLRAEGVLPSTPDDTPKSRPFTTAELEETLRRKENQSPLMRRLYDMARQKGIDPNVLEKRIQTVLNTPAAKKVMGAAGTAGRALFNPLTALGTLSAQFGYNMAPSIMGVTPIPEEFRTEPGVLPGVSPLPLGQMKLPDGSPSLADRIPPQVPEGGVPAGPGPEEFPPSEPAPIVDAEEEEDSYALTRQGEPQADILPPPGLAGPDERRTEVTTTERVPAQQEGESDSEFAQRVRERARIYKELLGDNDAARKAQAYGILAEVGWRLAGAKGRSVGERLSKGMEGAGAAFGQLAANQAAQERQTMASAIAAVEQENRDAMRFATQIRTKQMEIEKFNLPRQQKIAQRADLIQKMTPGITADGAINLATRLEDQTLVTDSLGNIRDPGTQQVVAYGPANQPTSEGGIGYVAQDYPFLRTGAAKPAAAFTEEEMKQARDERAGAQSLLSGVQRAKTSLTEAYGLTNVLLRGVTSVVQPIVGDIGPIDASNFGAANAIRQFQKDLRELLVLNPNRATKYELELMEPLMDNPNNIFKSPSIALANLLEIERTLVNRINSADYKLNPNVEYKQIGPIPLGTKKQPLPSNALGFMGEHFKAIPNSTVYYQRADGKVVGLTKQQYEQMMRGQ